MPIDTFEDFIRRVIEIIFWVLVLLPIVVLPLLFIGFPYIEGLLRLLIPIPVTANDLLVAALDPFKAIPLVNAVMQTALFRMSVFPGFTWAALIATLVILFERKYLAKMQMRVGPLYAGKYEGVLQPIADLFKLLGKEIIVPRATDKPAYLAVPLAGMAVAAALLALIPVSKQWVVTNLDVGLLVAFAVISFFPIVTIIAAWSSNSKYPFLGGLRALHQMVAYEIPMIISALGVVLLTRTLNLVEIVEAQSAVWFILLQPIAAVVFFCCLIAELERVPFDLPEAEPELVSGWLTEYSGMNFGVIQLSVYVKFYALAGLFTTLFLGGWYGPPLLPPAFAEANAVIWFTLKTLIVMATIITPRGVMTRIRIDVLLRSGWRKLLVLAFLNMFIALMLRQLGVAPV